jgi:putative tryptophan/tyrosine transport system substrate-binding protein
MKRREFILAVGGAALSPFAARAQQAKPVVGFLRSSTEANAAHLLPALAAGLKQAGWVEGESVAIVARYADNQRARLPALAAELARQKAAVIVADNASALAAKNATATPIVFASGGDPIAAGLVQRLNRPGGQVTGVLFLSGVVATKRFELLRQLVPKATIVAALTHPGSPTTDAERRDLQAAAGRTGQQIALYDINRRADLEPAFASFAARGIGAALVGAGPLLNSEAAVIVALAARHQVPAIYPQREMAVAGGLASYGTSITDAYREAGVYAGRILKGEKPGELPVIQSSKFEFVINLKTAKALGLEFHPQLLATADEVIE